MRRVEVQDASSASKRVVLYQKKESAGRWLQQPKHAARTCSGGKSNLESDVSSMNGDEMEMNGETTGGNL